MKKTKRLLVRPAVLLLMILLALGALTLQALADDSLTVERMASNADLPFYIVHAADVSDARGINIGITPYSTLQDAINAAVNGDTIYITEQTVLLDGVLIISSGKSITLSAAGDAADSGVTIVSAEGSRHMVLSGSGSITLTFSNVTLDGGGVSGGIYTSADALTLHSAVIRNCSAVSGGGVYINGGGSFTMIGGEISGNTALGANSFAGCGGGIYNAGGTLALKEGSVISGNTATSFGGGIYLSDSFLPSLLRTVKGSATIANSTVSGNTAQYYGGGLYLNNSDTSITGSVISGNISTFYGGGLYIEKSSDSTIMSSVIIGNIAGIHGGGLFVGDNSSVVKNGITNIEISGSVISDNISDGSGGGVAYFTESSSSTLKIAGGSRISDNTGYNGGGIYMRVTELLDTDSSTVFYGNTGRVLYEPPENADTLYPNIKYASVSTTMFDHPLNNFDISYTRSTAYYYMTVKAGAGGSITKGTSGYYAAGSTVEIAAAANDGYIFGRWSSDTGDEFIDASSANTSLIMPQRNVTITANFIELDEDNHFAYIIGYPNGNICPGSSITRAETATIFFRLLTQESRAGLWGKTNIYTDVNSAEWHNNAISTLTNGGVLTGDPGGTFRPNGNITRGELAVIAARFTSATYEGADLFDDIASHWAAEYINIAASLGWVEGYGDGTYHPNQYITRAEVAMLVNRVLKRLPDDSDDLLEDMVTWPDNLDTEEWYYLAIQEATNSHYYERKNGGIYETWTQLREAPDWKLLERPDSQPGDVSY